MTQQEFMNYLNKLTVGYRLTWEDIKYDADKAIHKINDYLGTCYPEISEVMTAPHHTYSITVEGKKIPIFNKRYLLSIVIPFVASEVLARDEEFTTIYNKYLVEVEEGLYNMFQNEFNKVPYMFRQSKDEGVFFAVDHPLHKTSIQKQNIPIIKFHIYYHANNNDITLDTSLVDVNSYNYGDEINLLTLPNTYISRDGAYAYTFKAWSYEPIDICSYAESPLKITSDIHLYAIWDKVSTLSVDAYGTVSIKDEYKDLITTLYVPRFVGNKYITAISSNFPGANIKEIILPQSSLMLDVGSFYNYTGILVLPKYDYFSNKPHVQICENAIGPGVYTYIFESSKVFYIPYSVTTIEANGVLCANVHCEIDGKPDGWDKDWGPNANEEWSVNNG